MQLAHADALAQVRHRRAIGDLHEGIVAVRQHQRVLAVLVGEEPEDAVLLQQPRDEGEVGFPVLHAILTRAVAAGQFQLVIGEAMGREDAGDDVAGGEVLEHPVVARQGQPPEPGAQHQLVAVCAGVGGELVDFGHQGVEGALVGVVVQGGGDVRSNRAGQGEGCGAATEQSQAAKFIQSFLAGEALREKARNAAGREGEAGVAVVRYCHWHALNSFPCKPLLG
ncbi:hypothetical protein D3C84_213440 [compost metagenome]